MYVHLLERALHAQLPEAEEQIVIQGARTGIDVGFSDLHHEAQHHGGAVLLENAGVFLLMVVRHVRGRHKNGWGFRT